MPLRRLDALERKRVQVAARTSHVTLVELARALQHVDDDPCFLFTRRSNDPAGARSADVLEGNKIEQQAELIIIRRHGVRFDDLLDHRRGFAFELAERLLVDFGVLALLEVVRPVQIPLETYTVRRCLESSAI